MKDEAGFLRYLDRSVKDKPRAKDSTPKSTREKSEAKQKTEADFAQDLDELKTMLQKEAYLNLLRLPSTELRQKIAGEMSEMWSLKITTLAKKLSNQDCPEEVRINVAKNVIDFTDKKVAKEWQSAFFDIYHNEKILTDPRDIGLGLHYLGEYINISQNFLAPLMHADNDIFVRYTDFPGQVGKIRDNTTYWTHEAVTTKYDSDEVRYKVIANFRELLNLGSVKKDNDAVISGDHIQVKHFNGKKFNVRFIDLRVNRDSNQLDQAA